MNPLLQIIEEQKKVRTKSQIMKDNWARKEFRDKVLATRAAKPKIHGQARSGKETRLYRIWCNLHDRCTKKYHHSYHNYGKRGIKCLWKNFMEFNNDMGLSYNEHVKKFGESNTSIDRVDNNGDYCKKNCKWSTRKEQSRNTRRTVLLTIDGESKSVKEWSELKGIPYKVLLGRVHRNWPQNMLFIIDATKNTYIKWNGKGIHKTEIENGWGHGTIRNRINKYGWSIEKAFTTPSRTQLKDKTLNNYDNKIPPPKR